MTDEARIYKDDFLIWFKDFLKDKGLGFSQCGSKVELGSDSRHDIDLETGSWKERTYSANSPPRWLYHIEPAGTGWKAVRAAVDG